MTPASTLEIQPIELSIADHMDISEFQALVPPKKRRSRMYQFAAHIRQLKESGYTDLQIKEWLASERVFVSREAVRCFCKKAAATIWQLSETAPVTPARLPDPQVPAPLPSAAPVPQPAEMSSADRIKAQVEEQKRAANSVRFKHNNR